MCLETFWRSGGWHLLFPHTAFDPARNLDAPTGGAQFAAKMTGENACLRALTEHNIRPTI
jgi:hypothetical protein